jgi:Protein of unknown function (DUF2809)
MTRSVVRVRATWYTVLTAIVAAGIASRTIHSGLPVWDKYLGDTLYAAMVYVIFRLLWPSVSGRLIAAITSITMILIELFQLTLIPAQMSTSANLLVRICARLLGTEFSRLDLAAYAVGIAALLGLDLIMRQRGTIGHTQAR